MSAEFLKRELERRQKSRRTYSLRLFAKDLDMSPGHLSLLISGKRKMTISVVKRVGTALGLSTSQRKNLMLSILTSEDLQHVTAEEAERKLREDEFAMIANWYYLAILSLARLPKVPFCSQKIAKRLGISRDETRVALRRLQDLGFIQESEGFLTRIEKPLRTTSQISSKAIQQFHKQTLALAAEKIETVSVDEREFSSVTMAVNPAHLPQVKKMIREFKSQICDEFEKGRPSEVYTLSIQVFPLTRQDRQ